MEQNFAIAYAEDAMILADLKDLLEHKPSQFNMDTRDLESFLHIVTQAKNFIKMTIDVYDNLIKAGHKLTFEAEIIHSQQ